MNNVFVQAAQKLKMHYGPFGLFSHIAQNKKNAFLLHRLKRFLKSRSCQQ